MTQPRKATVSVKGTEITVLVHREEDYISLTDIARHRNPDHSDDLIRNWLRNRNTIEFLGVWSPSTTPALNPSNSTGLDLAGGDKSTQARDIKTALRLTRNLLE